MVGEERVQQFQADLARVQDYITKGVVAPDLTVEEMNSVSEEYREAVERFSGHVFGILTNDQIIDLLRDSGLVHTNEDGTDFLPIYHEGFSWWKHANKREHTSHSLTQALEIGVYRKKGKSAVLAFTVRHHYHPGVFSQIPHGLDELRQKLPEFYPADEGNPWEISEANKEHQVKVPSRTIYATRRLQPSDLARDTQLLNGFLSGDYPRSWTDEKSGAENILHRVSRKLDNLNDQSGKFRAITEASINASRVIEQVIAGQAPLFK